MKQLLFCIAFIPSVLFAQDEVELKDLYWLQGTWQLTEAPTQYEAWRLEDGILKGSGYQIKDGDTIPFEQLKIFYSDSLKSVVYVADVKENKSPVYFKLAMDGKEFVFSNPDHDFPRVIRYERISEKLLKVYVGLVLEKDNESNLVFLFNKYGN